MPRVSFRARAREVKATLAIVGAAALVLLGRPVVRALSSHADATTCRALLARYADLSAAAAVPKNKGPDAAAPASRRPAVLPADVARCADAVTSAEAACAARANDADTFERCF